MATTETLEQALRLLIQDTKLYRQRTDVRFERIEQSALEVNQALTALSDKTEYSFSQVDKALTELSQQVKETTKQMGEQSRRMGTLVEDIVAPDMLRRMGTLVEDIVAPDMLRILRQVANIPEEVEGIINVRHKEFYGGKDLNGHPHMLELDAIARCGDYALINETKTTLRPEDVKDFVVRLAIVRDYFPQLVGKKIIGAVSSLWIDESLRKQATRQGLLVLALGEGMLQLQNEAGFQPKIF